MVIDLKKIFSSETLKKGGSVVALTGLLTVVFNFLINSRQLGASEFRQTAEILERRIDELKEENKKLQLRLDIEIAKREQLETRINIIVSAEYVKPIPEWIKVDGVVISLNKKYEEIFLKPRGYNKSDYIMHNDSAVWPHDIAAKFIQNDEEVIRTGRPWNGVELVPDGSGKNIRWRVFKYPFTYGIGDLNTGVAGFAILENPN